MAAGKDRPDFHHLITPGAVDAIVEVDRRVAVGGIEFQLVAQTNIGTGRFQGQDTVFVPAPSKARALDSHRPRPECPVSGKCLEPGIQRGLAGEVPAGDRGENRQGRLEVVVDIPPRPPMNM